MIAAEHRLALPAGYQLGKYRFKGLLGAGGFGITYLAEDHSLGRRVAIKELLPNDIATRLDGTTVVAKTKTDESNLAWARERFVEEGRALAACEHPNVVHVYEMVEANGTAYMVTKFEEGRSLADWLTGLGRKPTEAELRGLLLPILSGLEKVHRAGFLHRDLKPENIYITDDGRPLLLDFGSARQAVTDRTAMLTSIVTIGYAPFEQYYEDGKQGPWSDIYALSAVMYRAIHGEKPPEATRRLKNDSCLNLARTYSKEYSRDFLSAIDAGLAMEYKDRPQTVAAWRTMLQSGVIAQPEHFVLPVPKPSPLEPVIKFVKQRPLWAAGAGVLVLGAAIFAMIPANHVPAPIDATPTPKPIAIATPAPTPQPTSVPSTPSPSNNTASATPWTMPVATPTIATEATPVPQTHIKPNPWTNPETTPRPRDSSSDNNASAVEHKLVGIWSAKITNPSGFVTLHWEQKENGHYSLTRAGEVIDSGTVTAADGQMHRVSETTQQEADLSYELKTSRQLVTTDPSDANGPITWTRISKESSGESTTSHHHSSEGSRSSGGSGPSWHLPIRIPHLPF